jgi:hypothetical protein
MAKSLPEWVWENDAEDLPDTDHARCIAALGERFLACGGQLFVLTTRHDVRSSAGGGARSPAPSSTLQMEYLGLDWSRGLAQRCWGGEPFDAGPLGGAARQAAGIALLATVGRALAAGSAVRGDSTTPVRVGSDDFRQSLRPPGWPPRRHARRPARPSLFHPAVARGGDHR